MVVWKGWAICCCCAVVVLASISAEEELLRELLDESVYDASIRPRDINGGDGPCIVEIDLLLNAVGPVNSLKMEMTTSFYLRQEWVDPRLRFNNSEARETFEVGRKYFDKIWVPDLFFTFGTETERHEMTTPNVLIRLSSDGTVFYSQRITSTIRCFMDLTKFPHDRQNCRNSMMSYSYTTEDIIYRWSSKRNATGILPSAFLAEFTLLDLKVKDCTEVFATGTFTCLEVILVLNREIGYYLTQTYIPSVLIVMLSWAAFWIDHEAVPARISVGLLTVLTITTQSTGARAELPRVSYVKAIDVWMSMNLVFVFAAYMEYAVVTVMSRRYNKNLRNQSLDSAGQGSSVNLNSSFTETVISGNLGTLNGSTPPYPDTTTTTTTSNGNNDYNTNNDRNPNTNKNSNNNNSNDVPSIPQFLSAPQSSGVALTSVNLNHLDRSSPEDRSKPVVVEPSKKSKPQKRKLKRKLSVATRKRLIFNKNSGRRVDFHSRYLFPMAYLIFNFGYWFGYLD